MLLNPISLSEVEEVVKALPSSKALGPDYFIVDFFKAGWPFLSQDIWKLVEDSRKVRQVWSGLNATFIALIPKSQEATRPGEFQHVSVNYNGKRTR